MTAFASETLPHCRDAPPWTDCGDPAAAGFGLVYARRGANEAVVYTFDRAGLRHALTRFHCHHPSPEVVIHGRRFDVARR